MLQAWLVLWFRPRGVHVRTDPACRVRRLPRPGSRLDRASRGVSCSVCMGVRPWGS